MRRPAIREVGAQYRGKRVDGRGMAFAIQKRRKGSVVRMMATLITAGFWPFVGGRGPEARHRSFEPAASLQTLDITVVACIPRALE